MPKESDGTRLFWCDDDDRTRTVKTANIMATIANAMKLLICQLRMNATCYITFAAIHHASAKRAAAIERMSVVAKCL